MARASWNPERQRLGHPAPARAPGGQADLSTVLTEPAAEGLGHREAERASKMGLVQGGATDGCTGY